MGLNSIRNCFELLNAPSTVFIDETDATGTKSYDSNSSAERKIQHTVLE